MDSFFEWLSFLHYYSLFDLLMGNQVCCDDLRQEDPLQIIQAQDIKIAESHKEPQHPVPTQIVIPELAPGVKNVLVSKNLSQMLEGQASAASVIQKYDEDVYVGTVDKESLRPDGFGRMYKSDGSLYLGGFSQGKAHGPGAFIFPNGAYFQGQFVYNQARSEHGIYEAEGFKYVGSFKDNLFWGKGKEEGPKHSFEGEYVHGKRVNGTLKWRDQGDFDYFYTGTFNEQEQFHGNGILAENKGVYEGDFVKGIKQGQGYYKGVNGVKYRGEYRNGVKEGYGVIFNNDDSICYKGEFKNGLPHGKGASYFKDNATEAVWVEGIDQALIKALSHSDKGK